MRGFQKLPNWWFRCEGLKRFIGGNQSGESIAALKVLLAISLHIDFQSMSVKISFGELEDVTGLSRPMVSKGIKKLEKEQMIEVNRTGNTNEYTFLSDLKGDNGWAKLPSDLIKRQLRKISNRGVTALAALKVYITLLSIRNNNNDHTKISYEKIRNWTGLQDIHIRPGLDVLFNHSIIHITKSEVLDFSEGDKKAHNIYKIMGNLML